MHRILNRRTLIVAVAIGYLSILFAPAVSQAANCETAPEWTGTGPTTTVPAGGSINTAITNTPGDDPNTAATNEGGTVIVPNGAYAAFTVSKRVRVIAQNRYGAVVPNARQTAGWVEGFDFTNGPVNASGGTGESVFAHNRVWNGTGRVLRVSFGGETHCLGERFP